MRRLLVIFALMSALAAGCKMPGQAGQDEKGLWTGHEGSAWREMTVERLPDMNSPRGSHRTLAFGEEIVVLGGHTDGFKPIETSEYYADGAWHTVPMFYSHINGFAAPLQDGRVLLGGGSEQDFGIGQSWGTEVYDPATHAFTAVGIMTRKRAMSSALTLPDGRVLILGNWRADDSWEIWTPEGGFVPGGALSPGWGEPYVLPAGPDDYIIFGPWDSLGESPGGRVDHLDGTVEDAPLLEEWDLLPFYYHFPEHLQIADYTYLIPAVSRTTGEGTILKVASGKFSLLELEEPLPAAGPEGHPISWGQIQVDRPARLAWVQGYDMVSGGICFARIAYDATFDGGKASATYFYADPPEDGFPVTSARLLPGDRLVLVGGTDRKKGTSPPLVDNYKTFATAYVFHTEQARKAGIPLWAILGILILVGGCIALIVRRSRNNKEQPEAPVDESKLNRNLMEQMNALIEEKELFRRKDLRITDVASELATNKTYVSAFVNNMSGESFTTLITRYRVQYAQKLLQEHPEMLLDDIAEQSGFSSRTTFFRSFKAVTGMTPQEWKKTVR